MDNVCDITKNLQLHATLASQQFLSVEEGIWKLEDFIFYIYIVENRNESTLKYIVKCTDSVLYDL